MLGDTACQEAQLIVIVDAGCDKGGIVVTLCVRKGGWCCVLSKGNYDTSAVLGRKGKVKYIVSGSLLR